MENGLDRQRLYFIRHGETEYNRLNIIQGKGADLSLNETGLQQAAQFYSFYQDVPFDLLITSSLKRSIETVGPFSKRSIPQIQDPDLDEICWGIYEGMTSTPEMRLEYQLVLNAWHSGDLHKSISGGESAFDLFVRLQRFIEFLKTRKEEHILICSHGRAMRCLMCIVSGVPISEMYRFQHSNTGLYLVEKHETKYQLIASNDTRHLNLKYV